VEDLGYPFNTDKEQNSDVNSATYLSDGICGSAVYLAEHTNAVGIVSMTGSGYTAFEISSYRPKAGTYIFTANKHLLNALSLVWGVRTFYYDQVESTDRTIKDVNDMLKAENLIQTGDVVINTGSIPIFNMGRTNMLKVSVIE
jgi:pyruvate kinase